MPEIVEPVPATGEPAPGRIRWTRRQCDAIRDAGVLTGRYELIDGEIISKMGQNPPHSVGSLLLREALTAIFGGLYVRVQTTIDVAEADPDHNEPEPDAAVTSQPGMAYAARHPGPADLLLVAEVSDTTLRFDRGAKALLYARAGIREYWALDVTGRALFVHRGPTPEGYADIARYGAGEVVSPLAKPGAQIRVAELLPPAH
jgi:Uma2 family endonuclease